MKKYNLNDKVWSQFKISDLFNIHLSKVDNKADGMKVGNIPLMSAGNVNNGVTAFVETETENNPLFSKNKITISMFGKVFYQPYNFLSVSHGRINILELKDYEMNAQLGMFLARVIENSLKDLFSYNRMCSSKRLSNQIIMLPVDDNEKPDWKFMENYIKEREGKQRSYLLTYLLTTKINYWV
ncbi:restriction endonuclease subunit S [Mycoplasma hafezii]|uniref:restriction endonuclease subunit S n=1 Tax=Mycoplasma hafezii TaxID=525886 RepID=UPI003CEF24D7